MKKNTFRKWNRHNSLSTKKVLFDARLSARAYIYHYLEWPYAKAIFENSRLRMGCVNAWTDPYESAWCERLFGQQNELNGVNAYGLCWTKSTYDEPFWRMVGFRKANPIVRIKCLIDDVLTSMGRFIEGNEGSFYLSQVDYMKEKKLQNLAENVFSGQIKDVSSTACDLLSKKRNAFAFEAEVRQLWLSRDEKAESLYLPINTSIVDQVMISPHATKQEENTIKNELKDFEVTVKKSLILSSPKYF